MNKILSEMIKSEEERIKDSNILAQSLKMILAMDNQKNGPDFEPDFEEPEYDSPQKSEWVVAVDQWGFVTILKAPNIHPSFLDCKNAEEIGIPFELDVEHVSAGVYKWTCNLNSSYDYEYSYYEQEFEVIKEELLWSPN